LTSTGANYMAKGIRKNKFLLYLGLQWNQIDDMGAQQLGKAITRNTALRGMFLMGNYVTSEGARLILEGSVTFDDTPISIDIESLPIRPRNERMEANAELERTKVEAEKDAAEVAVNEAKFIEQEVAFHSIVHRNNLGEEIMEECEVLTEQRIGKEERDGKLPSPGNTEIVDVLANGNVDQNKNAQLTASSRNRNYLVDSENFEGQTNGEVDDMKMNGMNVTEAMRFFETCEDLND